MALDNKENIELSRTFDVADKGAVTEIISRRRKERKDKLYVKLDEANNRVIIGGRVALKLVIGRDIIILEDEFKSSYDCTVCEGTGEIINTCLKCVGKGTNRLGSPCSECNETGEIIKECASCNGKGALLEIPDQAKARPTSGVIQVCGPDCEAYKVGDRVAYTGYTGHLLPFKGNTRVRIMNEKEAMCLVEEVAGAIGDPIEFIDKDTAYDLS